MKIGFIGLGHMGSAMAGRLVGAGHSLTVYNRTRAKAQSLAERGANVADSPREAATGAEVLVTMLSDDSAVEAAVLGDAGVISALGPGCVHVSASTISPTFSARLSRAHEQAGQRYLAAPVLGRPEAAARGELVIVVAGPADAIELCRPLFDAFGKETRVFGDQPERANLVKLGVNFVFASLIETLGEAYALVEGSGIGAQDFLSLLNGSILQSPVVAAYGAKIADRQFAPAGFRLSLGEKDMRLAIEAAEQRGVPMPVGSVLRERLAAAMAEGYENCDWSAVARVSTRGAAA